MKKVLLSSALFLISFIGFSQTKGISYQAVIIDPNPIEIPGKDVTAQPYVSKDVWIRFGIYAGTTLQYEELHKTKTDEYGLVNLIIGGGVNTGKAGTFTSLSWDGVTKSIITSVSFDQGGRYTEVSNQKFTYVPYTLLAETAVKLAGVLPIASGGTGATNAIAARTNLGLGNVDNTADVDKPVSIATLAILDSKEAIANKSTNIIADSASSVKYPSVKAIKDYIDSRTANSNLANQANNANLAAKATALETPRTINGVPFDGTANITIPVGVTPPDANATTKGLVQLAGDLTGTAAAPAIAANSVTTAKIIDGAVTTSKLAAGAVNTAQVADGAITNAKITSVAGSKVTGDITGNAATATLATTATSANTATKLTTARTINGTPFDGTSDITITTNASTLSGTIGILNGGTGASTAAGARTNLGLVIGTDVLAQRTFGTAANSAATDFVAATEKGANNGVATLGNNGKIPSTQIPAISFQNVNVVNSDATMTAIAGAQVGSIAIRTDNNNNYVLSALPASTLSNWIALATPLYVSTVNGYAGPNVVLTTNDVAEGTTNKYFTDARVRNAISATAPLNFNTTSGVLSMTAASGSSDGYLSSADFTRFNNKQTALTAGVDYATPSGNITGNAANVTGIVSIANGGTGTSTATGALVALGAEPSANKSNDVDGDGSSITKFPTVKSIKDYVDRQSANAGVADNSITSAKINGTIAIAKGGTGASTAAGARTNLGLAIGTDVMAANATTALTGDVSGSGNGSFATTVNSVGGVSSSTIATLPGLITANTNAIAANTASITANTNSIATLNTNVSANTASITANATAIATNTASIATNATAITNEATTARAAELTLTNSVNANTASITANTNSIATLNTNVSANTASITANTTAIATNTASIATNATAITTEATTARAAELTLTNSVNANTASITANTNSIATLNTNVSANTASITANTNAIAANTTSITANSTDIATINTNLALKAPLASPAFTGSPTAPTPATSDNSTKVATTEYVKNSIVAANAGLSSIGAISGTSNAKGATISGTTELILTPADITNGGVVTTGAQTFAGAKTFSNTANFLTDIKVNGMNLGRPGMPTYTENTAVGFGVLSSYAPTSSTYSSNTGVGNNALRSLTNGGNNTAVGHNALYYALTSRFNTAIGTDALVNSTESNNVGIGASSGVKLTTGRDNVMVGYLSGFGMTNGSNNTIVGSQTYSQTSGAIQIGLGITTGSNNTIIGSKIFGLAPTLSNNVILADGAGNIRAQHDGTTGWTLGTITSGIWSGTTIGSNFGGAGSVNGILKGNGSGVVSAAVVGTDYLSPSGSAALLTNFPTLNQSTTGNAATATKLAATKNINGIAFDGSADITIAADANTLTGTTLASNVTASSLTSVGTITSGIWSATTIDIAKGGTGATTAATALTNLGAEASANKSTDITADAASTSKYPSVKLIKDYVDGRVASAGVSDGSITNVKLANSTTILGSTTMTLGGTVSSVTGLTSLAATNLSGTLSGTATALATGRTISTTGDVTYTSGAFDGTSNVTGSATLTNTTVTAGTYGSSTAIPTFTVDSKGRLTAASTVGITAGVNSLNYTSTSSYAEGGTISGTTLTLTAADATNPGLISTGIQTIVGSKTFSSSTTFNNDITVKGLNIGRGLGSIISNTSVGNSALSANITGNRNTATGYQALQNNTDGAANTAFGYQALQSNTTGGSNVALGNGALAQSNSFYNIGIGESALAFNYDGTSNIGIGRGPLTGNKHGSLNIGIGDGAGYNLNNYNYNSGTGGGNVFIGYYAARGPNLGSNNTAIGTQALNNNLSASNSYTYSNNVALGSGAGQSSLSDNNTFLGANSNLDNTNVNYTNFTNSTAIGYNAIVTASNTIQLGNTSVTAVNTSGTITAAGFTGPLTGNATTATTAGNITATSNTSLTSLANLATVGTITSGTWSATEVAIAKGGTGATTAAGARTNLGLGSLATSSSISNADVASGAAIAFSKLNITKADITGLGIQDGLTAGSGISISAGVISATGLTTSNIASNAGITNAQLANSSTTLGSTTMTLGGTVTSVTGLTSLAATNLTGTLSGTATSLATGRTISTTGDVTYTSGSFDGTGNVTGVATLAASGVSSGTYGSSTTIPVLTVDTKGRVTTASTVSITAGVNTLTYSSSPTYAAGGTISGTTLTLTAADATNPGLVSTGTQTFVGSKTFSATVSALSAIARGVNFAPTLTATASDDVLAGIDINPTFSNGSYLRVKNYGIRVQGIGIGTGSGNIATNTTVGNAALGYNTTGNQNTSYGYWSSMFNTTGSQNTAIGNWALKNNDIGSENTAIGHLTMQGDGNRNYNTAIGSRSQGAASGTFANTANTSVGYNSLNAVTSGSENTAIGKSAMYGLTTANYNTALGSGAGGAVVSGSTVKTTGDYGIYIGYNAVALTGSSANEIVIGSATSVGGYNTGLGNNSTTIGNSATQQTKIYGILNVSPNTAPSATNGLSSSIAAQNAGAGNQNGGDINLTPGTATGTGNAGKVIVNGGDMTVNTITVGLGKNNISTNTAVGYQTLNAVPSGGGGYNTAIGYQASLGNTSGSGNVALGYGSLAANTTSSDNTAVGAFALNTLNNGSSSSGNVAVGSTALGNGQYLTYNTAVGLGALNLANGTSGSPSTNNTALGFKALNKNTTGNNNIGIGSSALFNLTTASNNTAIGVDAGSYFSNVSNINATGTNGVYLGYKALPSADALTNEIVIGANSNGNGSNTITIGNSSTTRAVVYGSTSLSNLPVAATSGNGGDFTLEAQDGFTTGNTNGGNINLTPGSANASGTAGRVNINSVINVAAGTATASTNGVSSTITAQNAGTGNQNGGDINLTPGTATGTGTAGVVKINGRVQITGGSPGAGEVLISDANGLATWSNAVGSTVVTSTTSYAITLAEAYVFYTGTAAGTFSIPAAASGNAGKAITIKNKTAFGITITPASGTIFIDSANTGAASVAVGIEASNNWIKLVSDGTQWNVIRALF